ncbi:MAG: FAD-dependent oxidoreductase [Raoultibacter sp.]
MKDQLSRRTFLKSLAVLGAGAAGAGALAGCSSGQASNGATASAASSDITWDMETEVLVCGYGAAGAACAIEAADAGAKVLIIEKAALPGGSMGRCGGAIMGAGTAVQQELGVKDDANALYNWVKTCVNQKYELCPDNIIRTYADNAGKNIDWLQQMCTEYCKRDLFDVAMAVENEGAQGNEATGDGGNGVTSGCLNAVGCEYEKFGVAKSEAVARSHWALSEGKAANSGPELFEPLYENINKKVKDGSITTEFKTALSSFITDEAGTVIGVVATTDAGDINIKAAKGIMLATGGYCASDEMKMKFCQEALAYTTYMSHDCEGEGIKAAMGIGADLYNMCNFYPIEVAQVYQYDPQYNDVFASWLDMDNEGYMEVPAMNMAECHGGVKINVDAQVLDINGEPIPHLYASGNDVGTNIFGVPGNYPGCGCYVSFAFVYGRIAGQKLAAESAVA